MAGEAGQISASLTLDISKFTKALDDAKKAVSGMQKTASQAASAGGGGEAAAQSAKKVSEAVKKQKNELKNLSQAFKRLKDDYAQGITTQEQYQKKMQGVLSSANTLKNAIDDDASAYNRFNSVAANAAKELAKIDTAQERAAASAEKLRRKQMRQIRASILPAVEESPLPVSSPKEGKKLAASLAMVSKSYNSLNRAVEAGAIDAKKASDQYARLRAELKRLQPQVNDDQRAINALNSAMAASAGAEIFRKNQEDARMAAEKMAASIGNSTSKVGSFFKVMGTGIASGSRGMVMSITNITEAFQKGQMGGRMLSTFLLGDLMDAFMIGTFVTDGFNKAAKSLGPTMQNAANMLMSVGRAFPVVTVVASAAAAAFGYFFFNSDKAKDKTKNLTGALKENNDALEETKTLYFQTSEAISKTTTAADALIQSLTRSIMIAEGYTSEQLNALEVEEEMVKAADKTVEAKMQLTAAGQQFLKIEKEWLGIGSKIKKQQSELAKMRADAAASAAEGLIDPGQHKKIAEAEKKLVNLRAHELRLNKEVEEVLNGIHDANNAIKEGEKGRIQNSEKLFEIHKKLARLKKLQEDATVKTVSAQKKSTTAATVPSADKNAGLQFFVESMQESILEAERLQEKVSNLYEIIKMAPTGEQAGLLKSLGVKDAEAQLKKIEKRMGKLASEAFFIDPETGLKLKEMQEVALQQQKAKQDAEIQAKQYEKMKKAMEIAARASGLGISVTSKQVLDMDKSQRKSLEGRVSKREQIFEALKDLGLSSNSASKALKSMTFRISDAMVAFAQFADDLMVGVGNMAMGSFGDTFKLAGKGAGMAVGAAMGVDPETAGKVGEALGAFSDMMVGKIDVTSAAGNQYNMGEVIQAAFDQPIKAVADAFMPLADAAHLLASNFGGFLAQMITTFKPVVGLLGTVFKSVFEIIANVVGAFMPLMTILAAVINPIAAMLSNLLSALMPIVNIVLVFASAMLALGAVLNPVLGSFMALAVLADALAWVFGGAAAAVATGISNFGEAVAKVIDSFAKAVRGFAQWLDDNLGGFMSDSVRNLASGINALASNVRGATSGLGAFGNGMNETLDGMDAANALRDKENKAASKVLNAPQGFKVEKYRYEAMNAESFNPHTQSSLINRTTNIKIENITVQDGNDLLEMLQERANRTGGVNPSFG